MFILLLDVYFHFDSTNFLRKKLPRATNCYEMNLSTGVHARVLPLELFQRFIFYCTMFTRAFPQANQSLPCLFISLNDYEETVHLIRSYLFDILLIVHFLKLQKIFFHDLQFFLFMIYSFSRYFPFNLVSFFLLNIHLNF